MSAARPAPPKPVPKPGHVKVVRALYRYTAQQADELSFEEGDNLYILDVKTDPNWWKASCNGKIGLIPSNYVEESTEEILHPLHEAAKRGNLAFLKECLENKVSVNGLDKAGCTALHWAAHAGNEECVRELLKMSNIQINVQNKLGDTPLHSAAWKGHADIVKILLERGDQTFTEKYEVRHFLYTPEVLEECVKYFSGYMTEHLKSKVPGANPCLKNNENKTAFELTNDSTTAALLKPYHRMSSTADAEDYGDSDDSE